MDDLEREIQAHHADADTPEDVSPLAHFDSIEQPEDSTKDRDKNKSPANEVSGNNNSLFKFERWFRGKLKESRLHDWAMVLFTSALTIVAIEQYFLAKQNSIDSGAQFSKIVIATAQIKDAADSFSGSAKDINVGVGNAVNKLQSQADQTEQLGKTTKESLVVVQRAFIFPTPTWTDLTWPSSGKPNGKSLDITWQNSGGTPTQGLHIEEWEYFAPGVDPDPELFMKQNMGMKWQDVNLFLPPKATWVGHLENIPQTTMGAIENRQTNYVFWGSATYKDVFKGTDEHVTKFCYVINPYAFFMESMDKPTVHMMRFDQCRKYNCIDDECKVQ